jgi:hypothetical protein
VFCATARRGPLRRIRAERQGDQAHVSWQKGLIQLRMLAVQVSDYQGEALCHFARAADHGNVAGDV